MRKIDPFPFLLIWYFALLLKLSQPVVISYYSNFSLIFIQDSGFKFAAYRNFKKKGSLNRVFREMI